MDAPATRPRPRVLTELQRRVARIVLERSSDPDLALAGGAALISMGLVDRGTTDLDFFTTSAGIEGLLDSIEVLLVSEDLTVERQQVTPTFVRLVVSGDGERCQVDLAQDSRLMFVAPGPLGPTVAPEELAADKVLALFSRAVGRDFVDVFSLAQRFGKDRLLELAKQKDPGFEEGVFAQMLETIRRLDREEFAVDEAVLADLQAFFALWRDELVCPA